MRMLHHEGFSMGADGVLEMVSGAELASGQQPNLPRDRAAHPANPRAFIADTSRLIAALLSLPAVVAACVLALIAVVIPRTVADPDLWWHLRNAHTMLQQLAFVRFDTLSFTAAGAAWIDHEWLAELPFYLGWHAGGTTGVYLVTSVLIEAIFAGMLFLTWRASRSLCTASVATVIAALLSTISFGPRTLLFGWLALVIELIVLELSERYPRALFTLPLLFAFWINLHGSWLIGLAVLAVHTLGAFARVRGEWLESSAVDPRQVRKMVLTWSGVVAALFCNPWGWRLVAYPFDLAFHQTLNIANVQEWQNLDLHSARGRVVATVLVLLVARQMWKPRRWRLTELLLLGIGLWSAFNYSRFLFLLALLASPIVARSFQGRQTEQEPAKQPVFNAVLITVVLLLAGTAVKKKINTVDTAMEQFPVEAMPTLARLDVHRRVFNEFRWGGYLEWHSAERPVFIDSRVDIFEHNGSFKDYMDIVHIKQPLALLERYKIDAVLFEKDTPLVYLLTHTGGWETDYDDGKHVLLERR